jgi:predicted  nucleic acid-binding Zn-ribbon protein
VKHNKMAAIQKNRQIHELKCELKQKERLLVQKSEQIKQMGEKLTQQQFEIGELRSKLPKPPSDSEIHGTSM